MTTYSAVKDAALAGAYTGNTKSGGGYVWDTVLQHRVRCHPERGAPVPEGRPIPIDEKSKKHFWIGMVPAR